MAIHRGKFPDDASMEEIAVLVKVNRARLGINQAKLAQMTWTNQQVISRIESGNEQPAFRRKNANVFTRLESILLLDVVATDSPLRQAWREMLLREIKRQFDIEDLRYTIYSHNLVTPEMWQSGCQIEDVGALIKELNDRGELVAITMGRDTRSPQWWVIRLIGGDTLDANVLEDAIDG
jgi:DNA-binding XRE family transcriptional regulator